MLNTQNKLLQNIFSQLRIILLTQNTSESHFPLRKKFHCLLFYLKNELCFVSIFIFDFFFNFIFFRKIV